MRFRTIVAAAAIGSTLLAGSGPASADATDLGFTFVTDADDETPHGAVEVVVEQVDLGEEAGALGTAKCVAASTPRTKRARIEFRDAAGLPTFTFFHDVTFKWNCKVVTSLTRTVRYEIYQPQYSFAGYVHNSVTPVNRQVVTSSAQARFGICQDVAGQVCVLERQPSITWKVDATGRATVKQTP